MRILATLPLVALLALPALPAAAQSGPNANGPRTTVTIQKAPRSYLTQGPIDRPRRANEFQASAVYQPGFPNGGPVFQRTPLPGPFELPGFYRYGW